MKNRLILGAVDTAPIGHYAFTAQDLESFLNYDIKYRNGADVEAQDE